MKEDLEDLNTTSKRKRHYIIRYSLESMGEFILSYTSKDRRDVDMSSERGAESGNKSPSKEDRGFRIEHCRVRNQGGKLVLNGNRYASWKELLQDNDFVE